MLHIPLKGKSATDLSWAGLVMTLGIVYGDLGTSPLYTMQAILRAAPAITTDFILGALSCVFWTLTLQTSFKYVLITLRASNQGEGGIFALFTLIKNKKRWTFVAALIGACALLGDGVITPSITVTSAVEGLQMLTPAIPVVFGVLIILSGLFFAQQFGTSALGKYFGPVMVTWFLMLSLFGLLQLIHLPEVLKALNPYYAFRLISDHPHALILLGAVFLCTTGAEALYSDLGHCGLKNIRVSWIFVKISLLLMFYLRDRIALHWIILIGGIFFTIESTFLIANLTKFFEGGWMSVALSLLFFSVMYVWFRGSAILDGFIKQVKVSTYAPILEKLSDDETVPKYATHLIYISELKEEEEVERQIIYSILRNQPKRADVYWFVHLYFSEVVADLVRQGKVDPLSRYPSLHGAGVLGDFRFMIVDMIQNHDFDFTFYKQLLMNYFFVVKRVLVNEVKFWGLDPSLIAIEEVPILSSSEITLADRDLIKSSQAVNAAQVK